MANGGDKGKRVDETKSTEVRGTYLEFPKDVVPYRCRVYLPENPDQADRLLYLLHGRGDTEKDWHHHKTKFDIPKEVEAMIASGKIRPLAVVLPSSFLREGQWPPLKEFEKHLIALSESVEKHLDSTYSFRPRHRAIAGISMGGQLALYIGLGDPHRFSAIGAFSAALQDGKKRNEIVERLLRLDTSLQLFYLSCETQSQSKKNWTEELINANHALEKQLKTKKIRHEFHWVQAIHTWEQNWNEQLPSFLEVLSDVWNVPRQGLKNDAPGIDE